MQRAMHSVNTLPRLGSIVPRIPTTEVNIMKWIGLGALAHRAKFLLNENSTTILTGVGVVGTVSTAYLTGRASFKAADILAEERFDASRPENGGVVKDLSRRDQVKAVWHLYIPPVAVGGITISSIVLANRIGSKRMAALAIASGVSERAFQEYRAKVVERLGAKQDGAIHDDIAQDRVNRNPPGQVVVVSGKVLCMDSLTGRYFQSTIEDIKRAENKINHELNNFLYASLSEFYDELGLEPTPYTEMVGWNQQNRVEVRFSTAMAPNDEPCVVVDFVIPPTTDYTQRLHDV